ncbi:MAG: phage tail protein [Saprospiraceae bacterium]
MAENIYPPVGFYFKVNFAGAGITKEHSFKEVSGLSVELGVEEIAEGGELRFKHRLPSTPKYNNLILKRGLLVDSNLRKWVDKAITSFEFTPILISIELLNAAATPAMTWNVHNAWPVKWEVSQLDAMSNEVAIETLEIAFDYFEIKSGKA